MPKEQPIEIFMPPNILKAKVGSGGLDLGALRRAEQAMEELKEEFTNWIIEDVNNLTKVRNGYDAKATPETLGALYRAAHDLKGQAKTFEFPLVARVASSLCKFTEEGISAVALPISLIDAHVDAIKIIVRDNIKDSGNKMATVLSEELERQVEAFLKK